MTELTTRHAAAIQNGETIALPWRRGIVMTNLAISGLLVAIAIALWIGLGWRPDMLIVMALIYLVPDVLLKKNRQQLVLSDTGLVVPHMSLLHHGSASWESIHSIKARPLFGKFGIVQIDAASPTLGKKKLHIPLQFDVRADEVSAFLRAYQAARLGGDTDQSDPAARSASLNPSHHSA